ncbi:PAS domain-containing protein [Temperatibacter marinus]|uniref:PAS domain-containing protein n=1 Tax=Temperatibacter marinus TaxID=1456591 RepID=A0AA52HAP4_9PROT|nr:PAS domain-containing protein [Temperatibacter marinus]WND02960.1 PAS domain-containing protein [Temperatibacter marinus]
MKQVVEIDGRFSLGDKRLMKSHQKLLDVWTKLYSDENLDWPERRKIGLRDLGEEVPKIRVCEYLPSGRVNFRLSGSDLNSVLEIDLVHEDPYEKYAVDVMDLVEKVQKLIHDNACAALVRYYLHYPDGKVVDVETLMLPIKGPREDRKYTIGHMIERASRYDVLIKADSRIGFYKPSLVYVAEL